MPAIQKYLNAYIEEMECYLKAKELSRELDKAEKGKEDHESILKQMRETCLPAIQNHMENAYEKEMRMFSPKLPFDAEIVEFNPLLADDPQLVRTDPYGTGWIVKVKVSNMADIQTEAEARKEHSKEDCLLDANEYIESLTLSPEEKESINKEIEKLCKEAVEKTEEVLNDILPEAFAVVKETARRFKENTTIAVTATQHDRKLAVHCEHITIETGETGGQQLREVCNLCPEAQLQHLRQQREDTLARGLFKLFRHINGTHDGDHKIGENIGEQIQLYAMGIHHQQQNHKHGHQQQSLRNLQQVEQAYVFFALYNRNVNIVHCEDKRHGQQPPCVFGRKEVQRPEHAQTRDIGHARPSKRESCGSGSRRS